MDVSFTCASRQAHPYFGLCPVDSIARRWRVPPNRPGGRACLLDFLCNRGVASSTGYAQPRLRSQIPKRKRMSALFQWLITCMAILGTFAIGSAAQMVSPEMDDDPGPFSYFSQSTDEIGIPYAKSGTEITPEGSLYTGYGELLFFVGPEQRPIAARVRTLEEDYLPIINYEFRHLGIVYHFRVFSAPMNKGEPGASIVNFIWVTVANPGPKPRAAFLTSAFRYQAPQTTDRPGGDNRFLRPIAPTGVGQFDQPGEPFSKDWVYERKGCAFLRGGRAVYLFPGQPEPQLSLTLHTHYNRIHPQEAARLDVTPET